MSVDDIDPTEEGVYLYLEYLFVRIYEEEWKDGEKKNETDPVHVQLSFGYVIESYKFFIFKSMLTLWYDIPFSIRKQKGSNKTISCSSRP